MVSILFFIRSDYVFLREFQNDGGWVTIGQDFNSGFGIVYCRTTDRAYLRWRPFSEMLATTQRGQINMQSLVVNWTPMKKKFTVS